jgi:hypothetical protein
MRFSASILSAGVIEAVAATPGAAGGSLAVGAP